MAARRREAWLAVGDALVFVVFAVLGLIRHDDGVTLAGIARDAGPLIVGWFAAAVPLGVYRRPGPRTFLPAWLLGVTGGVLLRALVLGRALNARQLTFLGVTLATTLALLLAWRGLAWATGRARGRRTRSSV